MTRPKWAGLTNRQPADRRIQRQAARQEDWLQGRDTGGQRASYKVNKLPFFFFSCRSNDRDLLEKLLLAAPLTFNRFEVIFSGLLIIYCINIAMSCRIKYLAVAVVLKTLKFQGKGLICQE